MRSSSSFQHNGLNGISKKKNCVDVLYDSRRDEYEGSIENRIPPRVLEAFEEIFDSLQSQLAKCFSEHRAQLLCLDLHELGNDKVEASELTIISRHMKENVVSPEFESEEDDECRVPDAYDEGHIKLRAIASVDEPRKKSMVNAQCTKNMILNSVESSHSFSLDKSATLLERLDSKVTILGNLLRRNSISKGATGTNSFQTSISEEVAESPSFIERTLLPFWRETQKRLDDPIIFFSRRPSNLSRAENINFSRGARASFSRGSSLAVLEKMLKSVSNPVGRPRICWEGLGTIFILHDLVMIPLQVFDLPGIRFLAVIQVAYWTLDIPCCFFVAFHEKGLLERRPSRMAIRYLKTWFVLDVIIVVFDWVIYVFETSDGESDLKYVKAGRTLRLLRFIRLLRLLRLHAFYSKFLEQIHSEYALTAIGIVKLLTLIAFVNHLVACGWYALSEVPGETWDDMAFQNIQSLGYRYTTSLHWSLTQFTPASSEVMPTNLVERTYTVIVIMVAMVLFSSFISSITEAMTYLRRVNNVSNNQESSLRRYFGDHKVSMVLAMRVWRYLEQSAKARMVRKMWHEVDLLKELPSNLQMELQMEVYLPTLTKHPFFHHHSEENPSGLRDICHTAIIEQALLDNQDLFHSGQASLKMFFVVEGCLLYRRDPLISENSEVVEVLGESVTVQYGNWFCEAPIFIQWFHEGTMLARCSTLMLSLDAVAFQNSMEKYSHTLRECCRYAEYFLKWVLEHPHDLCDVCIDFDTQLHMTQMAFNETTVNTDQECIVTDDVNCEKVIGDANRNSQKSDSTASSRESFGDRISKWLRPVRIVS